jgi:uncharacterized DUF497 family protein
MFEWNDANLRKVAQHDVFPDEAEEVILNNPIDLEFETLSGEERVRQVGETNSGRLLVVVSTWRGENIRVVTAYPASKLLRTLYLKQKGIYHG